MRTVQRWERDFGLPIRRFGMGRAEVVHAYVEELDRWKATAEAEAAGRAGDAGAENATDAPSAVAAAPASGGRRFTTRLAIPAALLVVTAVALVLAWQSRGRITGPTDREAAVWGAAANRLFVKNASGDLLWDHEFPFTISNRPEPLQTDSPEASVRIDDVDGDGRNEVLVRTIPADGRKEDHRFYFFDSAGRPAVDLCGLDAAHLRRHECSRRRSRRPGSCSSRVPGPVKTSGWSRSTAPGFRAS